MKKLSNEDFLKRAIKIHDNKIIYLEEYINSSTKMKMKCKKCGLEFEMRPNNHIITSVFVILLFFGKENKFNDCKDQRLLPFDFYLPDYNMCIEFDGIQHFKPIEYFGGLKTYKETKRRDKIKNDYCKNNNIQLIRIKYDKNIKKFLESIFNI